jgi:hypothetical protein
MNKICTTIEQSKKLIKLGIDVNTADMWWAERYKGYTTMDFQYIVDEEPYYYLSLTRPSNNNYSQDTIKDIPAWSLTALIQVLPITIVDSWTDYCLMLDIKAKMPRYVKYGDVYHPEFPWDFKKQSLLDSIVESIFWLHKNNYLNGSNR